MKLKCGEAMDLLSPYLDGELAAAEVAAVEAHLQMCVTCRAEMESLRLISKTLRAEAGMVPAPSGFAEGVTAALRRERGPWYGRLPGVWKQAVAVAAACALIAAGSLHMGLFTRGGTPVAEKPPGPQVTQSGPVGADPGLPTPGTPDDPSAPGKTEPNAHDPATPPVGGDTPDKGGATKPPAADNQPPQVSEQVAFLNNLDRPRVIESTMLGVRVDDLNRAREQVAVATGQANGKMETLGVYNTANGRQETMKITVAAAAGPAVVERISALGEVVARENTSRDISTEYRSRAEQYLTLDSRIRSISSETERAELEQNLAGLEKQLRAWSNETGQHTIVVQLRVP